MAARQFNIAPQTSGGTFRWWGSDGNMVVDGSIGYRGDLTVVGVPKGAVWSITFSDMPVVRASELVGSRGGPVRQHQSRLGRPDGAGRTGDGGHMTNAVPRFLADGRVRPSGRR